MMPLHLFSYDPGTGALQNHGQCTTASGEAYSMGNLDGRLYIASYSRSKLSVYDPSRPYRFGTDRDANPREFPPMDEVSNRPQAMVAGPAGRVWMFTMPKYGVYGGALVSFDPQTETFRSRRPLLPDCSGISLTYLEEDRLLLAGCSVAHIGALPRAQKAGFVLWNPYEDREVWRGDLGLSIFTVVELCAVGEGLVYAQIASTDKQHSLALLDMRQRRIVSQTVFSEEPSGAPHGYTTQGIFVWQGQIYWFTTLGILRTPLGKTAPEVYWRVPPEDEATGNLRNGAVSDGRLYFGHHHRLLFIPLPTE